jgi:hypothetical protein
MDASTQIIDVTLAELIEAYCMLVSLTGEEQVVKTEVIPEEMIARFTIVHIETAIAEMKAQAQSAKGINA